MGVEHAGGARRSPLPARPVAAPRCGSPTGSVRAPARGSAPARGGRSPRCIGAELRVLDSAAESFHSSWLRHGARFSTRSMIDHSWSTRSLLRSRAFQIRPSRPPERRTRANSVSATGASNQWKRLGDGDRVEGQPARTGAAPRCRPPCGTPGHICAKAARIPGDRLDADERRTGRGQQPGELAGPRSHVRRRARPGSIRRCSTSHATASGG